MSSFVVEYNRKTRDWFVTSYPGTNGRKRAMAHRFELERRRPTTDWEIVSLNSDSIDTIRKTHSRYFEGRELSASPF